MKQETGKSKKWILPVVIAVILLLIAGGVAAFFLMQPQGEGEQSAEDPAAAADLYWNVDMKAMVDPETGLSSREANADGQYIVRFLKDGQLVELQIIDKQLVNYIDSMSAMGLVFDDSGVVVDVVEAKNVASELAKNFFVMKQEPGILTINSSQAANGMNLRLAITDKTGIYDVSPTAATIGELSTCGVLDEVSVYGDAEGNVTHVFIIERAIETGIYLRTKQMYSSGNTTRVPVDGVYTIEFAHNGELVQLKCKDKAIVKAIDAASAPKDQMGLVFDEEGYIVETITASRAIRGKLLADNYTITAIDGNVLSLEKKVYNAKDVGKTTTATLTENTEIYFAEAECEASFVGQKADGLQVGDRIFCYSDMDNNAKLIYIARRMQDYPIYYNVTQKYDSAKGETTREKENGWYVFEMIGEGKTRILKTKDKALANRIDSISSKAVAIKRSGDKIVDACHLNCVIGLRQAGEGRFVTSFMSNIVRIVSSSNFQSGGNYMLSNGAQVLDVTGDYGIKAGSQIKELRDGDRLSVWIDVDGNLGAATVTQRYYEGSKLYYNYTRTYNATLKQTKRLPDAEGYYVFPMVCEGKEVTVKTKSLELASFIDKDSSRFVALKVSKDGIVKNAYKNVSAVKYGRRVLNSVYYDGMTSDGKVKYYYFSEGKRLEGVSNQTLPKSAKIYNYSEIFTSYRGEKTKLQKGDQIACFARYDTKEIVQVFIKAREYDSKLYYPVAQKYNSTLQETTRELAEDGYYYVELAVEGQIKTFKTKSKAVMSLVDSYANAFGMKLNGDVIELVFPAASIRGIAGASGGYYDVMGIKGSKLNITRNRPASASTGKTMELELKKGYKVYDVSKTATQHGMESQLALGDRIVSYIDDDSKVVAVFIVNKHTREAGHIGYCEHCGKEVFWEHFGGTVYAADAHYYLPYTNESGYSQKTIGYSAAQLAEDETLQQYEIVFDLNGQTYYAKSRLALVYSTLTVMDSVGTGKVVAAGSGRAGGVVMLTSAGGATLNIYGGTLTNAADTEGHSNGGAVYCNKGTVNMYGGTITDCKSENGGAIYAANGGAVNIYGGKITGNTATSGDNLWVSSNATLNMEGGQISDGGIYMTASATAAVTATIQNATIDSAFEFVNARETRAKLSLENSTVSLLNVGENTDVILTGKIQGGVQLATGSLLDVTKLENTSALNIAADGVFTTEREDIAQLSTCFAPAVGGMTIKQEGNALSCSMGEVSVTADLSLSGDQGICPICKKVATWTPVTQAEFGETGMGIIATTGMHYYLAEDITYTGADTFVTSPGTGKTACFHLNGHNVTATQARVLGGYPGVFNIMGTGIVSGNYQNATHPEYASTVHINTNKSVGAINLYSGTYTQPEGNAQLTVTGSPANGGQINVFKDATIEAKSSAYVYYGGRSSACDTRFSVQGGTVLGGIYMDNLNTEKGFSAYLEINGGKVTGDIIVGKITTATISGSPELGGTIDLTSGTKLTLTDLALAAPVAVKANGIFTEATEQAETYKTMFKAAAGYAPVSVKENALFTEEQTAVSYTDNLTFTGSDAYCPVCQKVVTWTAITQEQHGTAGTGTPADGTHYYLAEDITADTTNGFVSGPVRSGQVPHVACFHLNGHNLTNTAGAAISGNSGILNVLGSGTVIGNLTSTVKSRGSTVNINTTAPQGVVNLYSGTYAQFEGNDMQAVIAVRDNGGKINIYEDVIVLCGAAENAVYLGTSKNNNTYVTIYGGNLGGDVRVAARYGEKETHLTISGGTINGDVIVGKISSFTLSGAPEIKGAVDLLSGTKITLGDLTNTTAIQVKAEGIFTEASDKAAMLVSKFAPAADYMPISVVDNALRTGNFNGMSNDNLAFAAGTTDASCPLCGKTVTWTAITGQETSVKLEKDGHYYLPADVAVNAADNGKDAYLYASLSGGTACLHLNGHDLTVTGHRAIISAPGTLNIMGNGIVSGETGTVSGAAVHVNSTAAGATVNLLGGTYTKGENDTVASAIYIGSNGGTVNMYKNAQIIGNGKVTAGNTSGVHLIGGEDKPAVFNMYGGKISSGKSDNMGGNVLIAGQYAAFVMRDGEITGGEAKNGGNIGVSKDAHLQILGGKVQNGTATSYGGNICAFSSDRIQIENALISGGTAASHGGNIFAEADLTMVNTTVTGGTAQNSKNGGNVYVGGKSTLQRDLVMENCVIGATTGIGTGDAFEKGGIAGSGGNLFTNYADVTLTDCRLVGGSTTSHGANVMLYYGKMTLNNTELIGGETTGQGGAMRVYKSTVIMNSGSISGGIAKKFAEYCNANISLSTESKLYMLGGTIVASENADRRGTAIDAGSNCSVYLGGNATIVDSSDLAGINARVGTVVRICNGWTGSAKIYLGKLYEAGQATIAQVVTLDKDLNETAGGAYTGTLTQQGGLTIVGNPDGTTKIG